MIIVEEGREDLFLKDYMKYVEDNEGPVVYKDKEIPLSSVKAIVCDKRSSGIKPERLYELCTVMNEENINITPFSAHQMLKAEHNGKTDIWIEKYKETGISSISYNSENEYLSELNRLFSEDKRFRGRIPQITPYIASVLNFYSCDKEVCSEIVSKFQINAVKGIVDSGINKMDAVHLFCALPIDNLIKITGKHELCETISSLLSKSVKKDNEGYKNIALWMANHPETNIQTIRDLYDNRDNVYIDKDMTVDAVLTKMSVSEGMDEVRRIEKAYKKCGFKLNDCKCLLKDNPTEYGRYKARILDGKDPYQVMLGELTNCCQCLGDAGETSMMYGLTNEHAGFFVLENKKSGKLYAQAEIWEYDEDTLVFDNIEFANDAEISQYKEALGAYVLNSPYKNIIMGCGYNGLNNGEFERAPAVTPHVTPYDIYVMSYEEDAEIPGMSEEDEKECLEISSVEKAKELLDSGKVTYYSYLYSDVDDGKGTVYLKKNGKVSDYFNIPEDRQKSGFIMGLKTGNIMEKALSVMIENNEDYENEEEETLEEI